MLTLYIGNRELTLKDINLIDAITEESIKNTIFNIDKELTCIIIAHRLSIIKNCDKILVMKDGCIVEVGNHNELINKKGLYYELCERQ